ncbi:MAG: hypothetical protein MJ133_09470 [Lachnospiraceae bacterium]|nr:hypothetical protein [Lachnospiraceae bacterium]
MLKIVIIYDSKKHDMLNTSVNVLSEKMTAYGNVNLIDISSFKLLHECFFAIQHHHADLHITLETAGFELRTEADKSSFNIIYGRFFHFITMEKDEYPALSDVENNLAHFIRTISGIPNPNTYTDIIDLLLKEAELI